MTITDIRKMIIAYTGDCQWADRNMESLFDYSRGWTYRRVGDTDWLSPEHMYDQLIEDFQADAEHAAA